MKTLRMTAIALACVAGINMAAADDDDDQGWTPYHYGHMGMMGPGMMGPGMMRDGRISDEHLDRMAELMAERHQRMQRLAETTDKEERRELLREHFRSMREFMGSGGMR